MSEKSVPSSSQEDPPRSKSWKFCWVRYMSPLTVCLVLGVIITCLFLYYRPWQIHTRHNEDITTLKSLTVTLSDRLNQLESAERTVMPSANSEQITDMEGRIATLQQQIEALQNQPKMAESPGQLEKSQALETNLNHLAETQKVIKTTLIFWRLKKKVLSDAPYATELTAYKAITKPDETLVLLEKYADQGLQALKAAPNEPLPTSSENQAVSWWSRLKAGARSLIKIEKIEAPIAQSPSSSQDRQAIEDILARLDQSLAQELNMPSPIPGDAL